MVSVQAKEADWYRHGWTLDIKNQTWTQQTEQQVDFLMRTLNLRGDEKILDLACGYGRHALSFARRGLSVTGVDLTPAYIEDAKKTAAEQGLDATFLCADLRDVSFCGQFDVVLNLADGAIGYLETEEENLKIFDVISRAQRPGGKHFMDVCNAEHAELFFPKRWWEAGPSSLAFAQFEWDSTARRMLFGGCELQFGQPLTAPDIPFGDPTRLYSVAELRQILAKRGLQIVTTYSDYDGHPASEKQMQLMVYSVKNRADAP